MSFPLQHLSIRVPWHEAAWNGSVCPGRNSYCIKLKRVTDLLRA